MMKVCVIAALDFWLACLRPVVRMRVTKSLFTTGLPLPGGVLQAMVEADILDEVALNDAIADCEAVYNFAAIADLNEALDKPLETVKVNILW